MVKNTLSTGKIFPYIEEKITPNIGKKLPTNNTNLNSTNTTTKRENAAVNFKKLKEEGEEKMMAVREQLRDLDFEGKFIEQILKDYSARKIEEKLDLLMGRRNIQNPTGWLSAALKNDYQDEESSLSFPRKRESIRSDEEPVGQAPRLSTENKEILSREEALQQIQLAKDRLDTITPSYQIKRRW
jgi:hypothetical protein